MSRLRISLNGLRAFEAAARLLSFSKAAEELHVTPTAVSHLIKELETTLGTKLFNRYGRTVTLNACGEELLPGIREGFERLSIALSDFEESRRSSKLRVLVPPTFAVRWLMPHIEQFTRQNALVDIKISAYRGLSDQEIGEADIIIKYGTDALPGWRSQALLSTKIFPVCSPGLLRGGRPLRQPSDLQFHVLLHDECAFSNPDSPDWAKWIRAARVSNVDPSKGPVFSPGHLALEAAVAGGGVALAKGVLVEDDLDAGRLVCPFDHSLDLEFCYSVQVPKQCSDSRVLAFEEWLLQECKRAETVHILKERESFPGVAGNRRIRLVKAS